MSDPLWITEFIREVYPDAPELAMSSSSERLCLQDATAVIRRLKAERDRLKDVLEWLPKCKECDRLLAELAEAKTERGQYQSDWLSASKTVVDYELEIDKLRDERKKYPHIDKALEIEGKYVKLREALELILPLAKGYAAEHPVGSNQEYVEHARTALAGGKE